MGNGVVVNANPQLSEFSRIEKLCKSSFFFEHNNQYSLEVEKAIEDNSLDILEVLIPSGNRKTVKPLHVAAHYAKLDVIELLVSAGFDSGAKDKQSQTPLHILAKNSKSDAILCGIFLILHNPKLLKARDFEGSTPLHLAVQNNNQKMVSLLIENGACIDIPNGRGVTADVLAKSLGLSKIIDFINDYVSQKGASNQKGQADMDRIMQVWDRFFENALKGFQDNFEAETELYDKYGLTIAEPKSGKASGKSESKTTRSPQNMPSSPHRKDDHTCAVYIDNDDKAYLYWFSWILCSTKGTGTSSSINYYVVSYYGEEASRWLTDHLEEMGRFDLMESKSQTQLKPPKLLFTTDSKIVAYPETLLQAARAGWMVFFDETVNQCSWMCVTTGQVEYYLPMGADPAAEELGLPNCDEDPVWVSCEQMCCFQWVFVAVSNNSCSTGEKEAFQGERGKKEAGMNCQGGAGKLTKQIGTTISSKRGGKELGKEQAPDDDWAMWDADDWGHTAGTSVDRTLVEGGGGERSGYYYNRVTGCSLWDAPLGYDEQVEQLDGWQLCLDGATECLYWYVCFLNSCRLNVCIV